MKLKRKFSFRNRMFSYLTAPLAVLFLHDTCNKYLYTYDDENDTAENGGLAGHAGAEAASDAETAHADGKGDRCNEQAADEGGEHAVLGNGEANAESINAGGNALQHQSGKTHGAAVRLLSTLVLYALPQHIAADEEKKYEGYPWDKALKSGENLHNGMYAEPAYHGHEELEKGKSAGDGAHAARLHFGFIQAICKGYGKGIHG